MKNKPTLPIKKVLALLSVSSAVLAASVISGGAVSASTSPKPGQQCNTVGDLSFDAVLICEKFGATRVWTDNRLPAGKYKVGSEQLLSGAAAFAGVPMDKGIQRAVKEINASGFLGKGATIELITRDSGGKADIAVAAINEFVANKVSGILCCALSSIAGSVSQFAANAKTPVIIDAAVLPGLAKPPYIHRTVIMTGARNGIQWQSAQKMVKAIGAKTVVIPETSDNQGMVADSLMYRDAVTQAGATNVISVRTLAADTDLSGAASQILAASPDLVIPAMLGGPASRLIKALRDRGYKGRIVGNYGLSDNTNFNIAGASLAGVVMPVIFDPENPANQIGKNLVTWWRKTNNGQNPSVYPGLGYTAMWYLAVAIKNSGDGRAPNVAKALNRINKMFTIYGEVRFDGGQIGLTKTASPTFKVWQADGKQINWDGK